METALVQFAPLNLDNSDPQSLYNLVPATFGEKLRTIPKELLEMSPEELKKVVKPGEILEALRMSFWLEYTKVIMQGKRVMNLRNVYGGICTEEYFLMQLPRSPALLAWVLTPPKNYLTSIQSLLHFSLSRLYELLNIPFTRESGAFDSSAARVVIKIYEMLDQRLHGGIVQRVESKNLNVNVVTNENMEQLETELDKRLKEIRSRERKLLHDTSTAGQESTTSSQTEGSGAA